MARAVRLAGTLLIAAGLLVLAWTLAVWRWQDPFTAIYTHYEQAKLAKSLDRQISAYPVEHRRPVTSVVREKRLVASAAAADRRSARVGQAIGRIIVPRIGLNMV